MVPQKHTDSGVRPDTLTIPELDQSKAAVLNTPASVHSRRSYEFAIDRFIAWYCSEPRLTFNRAVVVRYRSHLEGRSLSASTINLHLSAIRRLADESAESGWLTPELAIGIRRVQGVKRLGRKSGNWLSQDQAQELVNAASKTDLRGWRDGAIVGLLLGCGLRRSEVVGLTLDQVQTRDGRWVIIDLIGKGRRLRTVPVPLWSKQLLDAWLQRSGVSEGRVFRRISKQGKRQEAGVTANVVWYAVKRCADQAGIANLAPHDLRRYAESRTIVPNANSVRRLAEVIPGAHCANLKQFVGLARTHAPLAAQRAMAEARMNTWVVEHPAKMGAADSESSLEAMAKV